MALLAGAATTLVSSLFLVVLDESSPLHNNQKQADEQLLVRSSRRSNSTDDDDSNNTIIHHPHVYDVLIIGSGWSGLGASDTPRKAGVHNFEILEARNAVGGRSRTVYPFTDDLAVEMGSAWTYEDTAVHQILKDNHIPFGEIHYDLDKTFGLYQSGHFEGESKKVTGEIIGNERDQLIDKVWWHGLVRFSDKKTGAIIGSGNDVPYQHILHDYIHHRGYAENSKPRQFLQSMIHSQIQVEYAAPLNEISASYVGQKLNDCIFCSAIYYVPVQGGGFDKVLAPLADPLKDKIRLNRIGVTKIEYSEDDKPARVSYIDANDGTKHTKLAQKVLVTVPLGVLKANSIDFVPTLPKWKQDAINYIGFGVLNKCIFYWESEAQASSWWPHGKEYMTLVTEQDATAGVWTSFFNDREIGNGGHFVLSAWIGGDNAKAIESLSDQAIVKQVLGNLRAMLGDHVPEPSKYVISRWGQDEFARGCYSFVNVGGRDPVHKARKKLASTVAKRLFWAGEATTADYGTTYGAYGSGITAAKRIMKSLQKSNLMR
jgi:monoamine oxidase